MTRETFGAGVKNKLKQLHSATLILAAYLEPILKHPASVFF